MPTFVADRTNNKSLHVPMHLPSDAFYLKEATTPFEISQTRMIRLSKYLLLVPSESAIDILPACV